MRTVNKVGGANGTIFTEFYGNTTDVKPTEDVPNGSAFYEVDNNMQEYRFDKENKIWYPITRGGTAPSDEYLPLSGGIMTGDINMNGNSLLNAKSIYANDNTDINKVKYISGLLPTNIFINNYNTVGYNLVGINISENTFTFYSNDKNNKHSQIEIIYNVEDNLPRLSFKAGYNDRINLPVLLKGVDTPVDDTDAANKQYVDQETTKYLPLTGGKMTGNINLNNKSIYGIFDITFKPDVQLKSGVGNNRNYLQVVRVGTDNKLSIKAADAVEDDELVTKSQMETADSKYLPLTGTTEDNPVTGVVTFNGESTITGVSTPVNDTDVVTKKYADDIKTELDDKTNQLKEDLDKQMGGYIREVATAGAGILENWGFTYHINLLKGKNIRFLMSGYEGDGFERTRLVGYDSENTPTSFNNDIHLGDDITFTADKNYKKFFVQIVSSEKQSGNKCDFTIIADTAGLGAQLFEIKNEAVSKSGDSEVRINNTQFFKTINLFDLSEGVDEKTVLNTQNPVPNDNYFVSKKLRNFKAGKTYIAKNFNNTVVAWQIFVTAWKNDGTFINVQNVGTVSGFVKTFIIPDQADYIKISSANINKESIMIVEGTVEPYAYVPYTAAEATSYISLPQEGFVHVYHVEKDGSGDFNKLIDAIEYAEKWMDSVIYIGDGTWDLLSELGSEYVESASNSKRGIYLKNRIHLIGSSRSLITAHYKGSNQQTKTWLAPFNSGEYGFTLENITLESSNLRYSVHDERDTSAEPYTNKYIDCNFKTDNSNGGLRQCIGGGLGRDGHIFIRGCIFNSVTANHNSAVSYHNTWYKGGTGKSFIDIQNSYVKGTGTFRFSWFGDSTEMTQVLCANNSVGSQIQFIQETTDTSLGVAIDIVNMELFAWNNEVRAS